MAGKNSLKIDEKEKLEPGFLSQKFNVFLISYFNYLALAVALIVFIAGLFFFIYPQYKSIAANVRLAEDKLKIDFQSKKDYLSKIINLKRSYQQISGADREKILEMVPTDDRITNLIPEIESIVLRNSAVMHSIKVEPQTSKSGAKTDPNSGSASAGIFNESLPAKTNLVKIEINLGSVNYQVLKNIIKTLENNVRLLDVAKISYSVSDNKVSLVMYAYYLSN